MVARPVFAPLAIEAEQPSHEAWDRLVGMFAGAVGRGRIDKVVLARRVGLRSPVELDVPNALRRLAASAPESTTFAFRRGGRTFLGSTPERLARTEGRSFRTMAVAGSIRRGADADRGRGPRRGPARLREGSRGAGRSSSTRSATSWRRSPRRSRSRPSPSVMTLRFVQHLATEISGTLPEARGLLSVAGLLHPTPAVGGEPRDVALALVDEHEGFDRGWYAGPIGWLGADGDGELCVALRCGIVDRTRATLFAGCGIVADSDADRRVGGVADQAPGGRDGAGHPGGRAVSDAALLRAFVAELVAAGVRDAVVCPGSRSTPLALALRANGDLRVRVLLDERAAGFFAVGMARTDRRPVVVLVTSGTAAMELGPAVVEAALLAGAADRAHGRPARRAARPRGAADDRPGPPLRPSGEVVRGAAAVRRRSGDRGARALAGGSRGGDGARRTRGSRASQRAVPRAAAAGRSAGATSASRLPFATGVDGRRTLDDAAIDATRGAPRGVRSAGLIVAGPDDDPALPEALAALAASDRLPDPRRPAVRPPDRAATTGPGHRTRRPARSARAPWIDAHRARARHPDRRDAHLQADRGAARADDGRS